MSASRFGVLAGCALACLAFTTTVVRADIIFDDGTLNPHTVVDINNGQSPSSAILGTAVQGNVPVLFSSTTDALDPQGQGNAFLIAGDGTLNSIAIEVVKGSYTGLEFNPRTDTASSDALVVVWTTHGTYSYVYPDGLGNGNNRLSLYTDGQIADERILRTTITSTEGFGDLRQPRIQGAAQDNPFHPPPPTPAPEPATVILWAVSAAALAGGRWLHQRRSR